VVGQHLGVDEVMLLERPQENPIFRSVSSAICGHWSMMASL